MAEGTINLDGRRGMAAQKATRMRRLLAAVDADHAALRARQEELEHLLLAAVDANRAVRARQRNWSTCFSPRLPPTGLKPWPRPVIF